MRDEDPPPAVGRQRIDKWLWHARLARTRTTAQALAVSGRVRVNRDKVEAGSRPLKAGDVLTIALDRSVRVLRVVGFSERRGPPASVRGLYEDLSPPPPTSGEGPGAALDKGPRPSPRDRERILALKHRGAYGDEEHGP